MRRRRVLDDGLHVGRRIGGCPTSRLSRVGCRAAPSGSQNPQGSVLIDDRRRFHASHERI